MQTTFSSSRLLQPVRPWFVLATLFAAFMANLLPATYVPWLPDWLAFVLCFWSVRETRRVGMGTALLFGLAMDVADGAIMGQHALAYVLLAYASGAVARRVLWFPLVQQAAHMLPLFVAAELVQVLARLIAGADFPGFSVFVGPIFAGLMWVPGTYLLLLPQYQPVERDENRPI